MSDGNALARSSFNRIQRPVLHGKSMVCHTP
jgi:hypothetical protein